MKIKVIKNREGDIVPFDSSRIERAIERACESIGLKEIDFIDEITIDIVDVLSEKVSQPDNEKILTIEEIQDVVEHKLMEFGYFEVAKRYIIYRQERHNERNKQIQESQEKLKQNALEITKSDGSKEIFDIEKVRNTYKRVSFGLARACKFEELEESLNKYIVEGIKTKDILKMMIKSCIDLVTVENIQWEKIAGRLMTIDLYKEASNNR